jgi:hypothetical protein
MWAPIMVKHATFYNVLLGGMILYFIKVTLDLWEEITYY